MANCRKPNPKFEDKKLQEFLDGANEGVVYVSFGSVLKASEMSPEKLKDLLKVRGCFVTGNLMGDLELLKFLAFFPCLVSNIKFLQQLLRTSRGHGKLRLS